MYSLWLFGEFVEHGGRGGKCGRDRSQHVAFSLTSADRMHVASDIERLLRFRSVTLNDAEEYAKVCTVLQIHERLS